MYNVHTCMLNLYQNYMKLFSLFNKEKFRVANKDNHGN